MIDRFIIIYKFPQIGHSLISLKISHGFSAQVNQLPEALNQLEKLEELVLSNNKIRSMTDTSFHFLKSLKSLEINDNLIEILFKGTFQRDIHSHLEEVSMDFNSLKLITTHTFVDLEVSSLKYDYHKSFTISYYFAESSYNQT